MFQQSPIQLAAEIDLTFPAVQPGSDPAGDDGNSDSAVLLQPHSARALVSTLGKKRGGTIKGERAEKGQPLVYRLPAAD